MSAARRAVVACFCLLLSLAFLRVPWTNDAGYSWLWSKPQPKAIRNDIVADARQRWDVEYQASDLDKVGEKWVNVIQQAPPVDKERVRQEAKRAFEFAKLRRINLSKRRTLSDDEVLDWLEPRDNFDKTFPEKASLDESARSNMLAEWKQIVLPAKEWNERIQYTSVDYRRIGIELAALTALLALGLVVTPRRDTGPGTH